MHLAKNDVQAHRNEMEEEVENRAQAALAYEIEDMNIAMATQHLKELKTVDVSMLGEDNYLGREQINVLDIAHEVYKEQASTLARLRNPVYSKLYSSEWIITALAFMLRVAPHYNTQNVMLESHLRTWLDVNMGVRELLYICLMCGS
jgi:hypothetical protein